MTVFTPVIAVMYVVVSCLALLLAFGFITETGINIMSTFVKTKIGQKLTIKLISFNDNFNVEDKIISRLSFVKKYRDSNRI